MSMYVYMYVYMYIYVYIYIYMYIYILQKYVSTESISISLDTKIWGPEMPTRCRLAAGRKFPGLKIEEIRRPMMGTHGEHAKCGKMIGQIWEQ